MASLKEIFKELIVDFHTSSLPELIKRDITIPNLGKDIRKAFVFIGMRRSGKTWTLYQIMQDLIELGVNKTKMLYLNFEDERLIDMDTEHFQDVLTGYFELYPHYLQKSDIYFFFDEIHEINGWEKFIRRLLDQTRIQIYVTGSSAKMLSKEIASSLRGRTFVQEIFPFSFSEYLQKINFTVPKAFGSKAKIELSHHMGNFLQWGGFPEVIGCAEDIHRQLLQEYISSVIYRDIIDRYKITNSHLLKQLLTHSLRNSARAFSVIKMYNSFKSMGYVTSKNSLYEFMAYFEDAYCIFSLSKFDISHRKSTTSMKKIFAIDQGLITAITVGSQFDMSIQLETAVFSHFRRQSNSIYYYRTQDGKEVDFLILESDQSMRLVQVSIHLTDQRTRKREIDALVTAMKELNLKQGTIITVDQDEELEIPEGKISIIPAYKALLTRNYI